VRDVKFHGGGYKLWASAGDEGAVQVFWADVGAGEVDSNPVIVPLKVLRGHRVTNHIGESPFFRFGEAGLIIVQVCQRLGGIQGCRGLFPPGRMARRFFGLNVVAPVEGEIRYLNN
jgi:hypothetical protein